MFDGIMVVGALTHCVLIHTGCDLKTTKIKVSTSSNSGTYALRVLSGPKHCGGTQMHLFFEKWRIWWFKKFPWDSRNVNDQARLDVPKSVASDAVHKAIVINPVSLASHNWVWFVTFTFSRKAFESAEKRPHVIKTLQNIWITLEDGISDKHLF